MNESSESAITNIQNAIRQFQERLTTGVPGTPNILKHKIFFMDAVKEDITLLKQNYIQEDNKDRIERLLDRTAIEILKSGNLYFKQQPNATSFIEDNFMIEVREVINGYPLSSLMESELRSARESWHWHGW